MSQWDMVTHPITPGVYRSQNSRTLSPYQIVEDFEHALCAFTGSPYAVAVSSCTIALEMICAYLKVEDITIPKRTYASVPQAIVKTGGRVYFGDINWHGAYQLLPSPIWDCAPRFTKPMYEPGTYQCLSFHRRKVLGHTEGGAILLDNEQASHILRVMRHDGRPAGAPMPIMIGYHAVMSPGIAAELLAKLPYIGDGWEMPCDDYPDLSRIEWNKLAAPRLRHFLGRDEDPLYTHRDANNRLFVKAWRRLQELDPVMWKEYQQGISDNDRKIMELMACK